MRSYSAIERWSIESSRAVDEGLFGSRPWGVTDERWQSLFSDLEAEAAAADTAQLRAEVMDRTRREVASLRLVDQLRAAVGHSIQVGVVPGMVVTGQLIDVGADWLLLAEPSRGSALVPLRHVVTTTGLTGQAVAPGSEGRVAAALDLRFALRGLSRARSNVMVFAVDGSTVLGRVDRVGAQRPGRGDH